MHTKVIDPVNGPSARRKGPAVVTIDRDEVERLSGWSGGPEVARVDIESPDGKTGRFWVQVTIANNGQPRIHVSALGVTSKSDRRKTVTGHWVNVRSEGTP